MNDLIKPFVQIEDKHGAVASIFFLDDQRHEVHYRDNTGTKFFTEKFDRVSIELVEKSVMDWATGKRELIL
jgi:hypothetical protein